MLSGKILYAVHDGTYVIKLIGDVRVPMCTSLDGFLEKMFADPALNSVLVDLTETSGIDSTALGLIAKIAVFLKQRSTKPVLLSCNPDVNRVLFSMGFDRVFIILESPRCDGQQTLDELPQDEPSEHELTRKVIEAHRTLMGMNEQNKETFRNLVDALESEQRAHRHHG